MRDLKNTYCLPAILSGHPALSEPLPPWPPQDKNYLASLENVLISGQWWSMGGHEVKRFEKRFAEIHQAQSAIACTNGTHALELALRALNIGPGDEVIVPSMTFVATSMAVMLVGATPIAVDVDPDHWCMDPEAILPALSPNTKALIPVHFAGHICDMEAILAIAQAHNLAVIEDAAHAHAAIRGDKYAGSFGDMAAFSFQNFKLMTAGEGGILLSNDPDLTTRAQLIANCGRPAGDNRYQHILPGSNMRLSEFQGAVLNIQCDHLQERADRRDRNGRLLMTLLGNIPGVQVQKCHPDIDRHSYYMMVFTCDPQAFGGLSRDKIVTALNAEMVPAFRLYPRIQDTAHFRESRVNTSSVAQKCPISKQLAENGIWLHHRILLADERLVHQVGEALLKIVHYGADINNILFE